MRGEQVFRPTLIRRSAVSGIVLLFIDMAVIMLAQEAKKNEENLRKKMSVHPLVSAVIKTFPGAHLESVRLQKGIEADLPETEEFSAFQEEE